MEIKVIEIKLKKRCKIHYKLTKKVEIMQSIVKSIAKKYSLESIEQNVEDLKSVDSVNIAFLGEFSSGKSSLLNHILEQNILPTGDQPTTKTIVEIMGGGSNDSIKAYTKDGEEISLLDFVDQNTASSHDKIFLNIPSTDFFLKNYTFVDTPGISSLDKSDTDITFGYLPFLDGAIIASDIEKGTISPSILEFLAKPELKTMINNIVFAITKADSKSETDQQKIKEQFIQDLQNYVQSNGLNIKNIADKVVLVSTNNDLLEFKSIVKKHIFDKKEQLLKEKKEKELCKISTNLVELLKEYRDNLEIDFSDIEAKEQTIKDEKQDIENAKRDFANKIETTKTTLENDLKTIISNRLTVLRTINDTQEAQQHLQSMQEEIQLSVDNNIKRFLDTDIALNLPSSMLVSLQTEITEILRYVDVGKTVGTFILADLLIPGSGAVGAAEGAGGVAAREVAKTTAKTAAKVATKVAWLSTVGKIMKEINPVEHVGDFLQKSWIGSKLENSAMQITSNVLSNVFMAIEGETNSMFEEYNNTLKAKQTLLQELYRQRDEKFDEFDRIKDDINQDIKSLKEIC